MQGIYFQIYSIRINNKFQTEVKNQNVSVNTNVERKCEDSVTREKADETRKDADGSARIQIYINSSSSQNKFVV